MNLYPGRIEDQTFGKRRLAENPLPRGIAASNHDDADLCKSCKLCNLKWHILSKYYLNMRSQTLRKLLVVLQTLFVLCTHPGNCRRFYKECRKTSMVRLDHTCCGTNDPWIRRRGRQADQDMFLRAAIYICCIAGRCAVIPG